MAATGKHGGARKGAAGKRDYSSETTMPLD
jgi:hypothetical protein